MSLEIKDELVGEIRVLALAGRLDTDTSADLELAVQDFLQEGSTDFVIDLQGVGYVSSAGLRVLLAMAKSLEGKGRLRLCALNQTVRQVFDVAGFTQLFSISANRDAALGASKGKPAAAAVPLAPQAERLLRIQAGAAKAGSAAPAELVAEVSRLLAAAAKG